MSDLLYAKEGKIYCSEYTEVYIPSFYFDNNSAVNNGSFIQTFGVLYVRSYHDGAPGKLQMMNLPVVVDIMLYEFRKDTIHIAQRSLDVMALQFMKDSHVMHQTLQKGREVAESFLEMMLSGKLPNTIDYRKLINMWWRNLMISDVSFKVPSKIYEMIIAAVYRDPADPKKRYGQWFGKQDDPTGYEYATGTLRSVVKNLSTFSGMVFEDISSMITHGINTSLNGEEEPESPLEKIIHY